jgi:hypothetical protein
MSTANPIHSRLHCKINARITHFMLMYSLLSHYGCEAGDDKDNDEIAARAFQRQRKKRK